MLKRKEFFLMKRISLISGGWLGALSALIVVALVYLGEQLAGLPFVPFDIFDWMMRVLPGGLIAFVVDTIVRLITGLGLGPTAAVAKQAEMAIAIVQFILTGVVFGLVLAVLGRRWPGYLVSFGALGGLLLFLALMLIEISSRTVRI
jgi:uncharacterized membrane protein YagU involved in acid resistance